MHVWVGNSFSVYPCYSYSILQYLDAQCMYWISTRIIEQISLDAVVGATVILQLGTVWLLLCTSSVVFHKSLSCLCLEAEVQPQDCSPMRTGLGHIVRRALGN